MPKKTKKEKILAEYRRKIKLLNLKHQKIKTLSEIETPNVKKENERSQPLPFLKDKKQIEIQNSQQLTSSNYIIKDIKKTAIITFLILIFEFLASFFYYKLSNQ